MSQLKSIFFHVEFNTYGWVVFLPKIGVVLGNKCDMTGGEVATAYGLELGLFNFDMFIGFLKVKK